MKKEPKDLTPNRELFYKYIQPNLDTIHSLVFFYAQDKGEVESIYNGVLEVMFKYVHTYDTSKSLKTWLHIVTKRHVQKMNRIQSNINSYRHGLVYDDYNDNYTTKNNDACIEVKSVSMQTDSLMVNLSDGVLNVLRSISPLLLSPFLLHYQGYAKEDIAEMEKKRGHIPMDEEDAERIVMSRIYMARRQIKKWLIKNGITSSTCLS